MVAPITPLSDYDVDVSASDLGAVLVDGSRPLIADWNAGDFQITSKNSDDVRNVLTGGMDRGGTADNTAIFQTIWNAHQAGNFKPTLLFPNGNYNFTGALTYPPVDPAQGHMDWEGTDLYVTRIKVSQATATPFITMSPVLGYVVIRKMGFFNNASSATAFLNITTGGNWLFEDCYFQGLPKAITFTGQTAFANFRRCVFDGQSVAAVEALAAGSNRPTEFTFTDCIFLNHAGNSVVFKGSAMFFAASIFFINCEWEVSGPVVLDNVIQASFLNSHSEEQRLLTCTAVNGPVKLLTMKNTVGSASTNGMLPLASLTGTVLASIEQTDLQLTNALTGFVVDVDATSSDCTVTQTTTGGAGTITGLVRNLATTSLGSYANNAAAVAAGLAKGAFYQVTASDPRQIAVVF